MINYRTEEEIKYLRDSSLLVGKTLAEVAKYIKPGIKTVELDIIAEEFIRTHGGVPGFKGYRGYRNTLCVSVNDEIVHGIPDDTIINEGDIVSVDCGVIKNGYYGDSAYTFAVGNVQSEKTLLLKVTKEALYKGIETAVAGRRIGDIGYEIQRYVESFGYSIVRDLVGHGVGKNLHEEPQVPNFGKKGHGIKLKEGMVICIEPMVNLGSKDVVQNEDGWTLRTKDGKPSAHYEHEIVIRNDKAEVLSTFEFIESVLNIKN